MCASAVKVEGLIHLAGGVSRAAHECAVIRAGGVVGGIVEGVVGDEAGRDVGLRLRDWREKKDVGEGGN